MRERLTGMQDPKLALRGDEVDVILERTEVAQQGFKGTLFIADTAFTDREILEARRGKPAQNTIQRHKPTPLPNPPQ